MVGGVKRDGLWEEDHDVMIGGVRRDELGEEDHDVMEGEVERDGRKIMIRW